MVSISAPSIRNTFAVLRRFMECLLREFTAMNASPPAIRPAALLLIYASVFFDMVISSLTLYSISSAADAISSRSEARWCLLRISAATLTATEL